MFYTLTANPAVDMTVSSSPLEPDENVRTGSASYTANGKGLDVSFAFKKMGVDTVALGFFAGFTGKFIVEEVMNLGCLCRPVWTDGITRINTYVNDGQHEYGILNPGAPITPQHQEELYNILDTAGDLECLIVSGSVPPKATPDFLAQVMEHAQARGADVVLDLSSDKLKELAHKKPLLIKPNHHEMKAIFGVPVDTDDEVRVAMKMAHDAGVQNVLLTRGSRGDAYFSNGEDIWYAKREFNIKLVSSVCAGDCTLAAFLHKWYRDRDNVEEAMKLAMATGANVAESVGIVTSVTSTSTASALLSASSIVSNRNATYSCACGAPVSAGAPFLFRHGGEVSCRTSSLPHRSPSCPSLLPMRGIYFQ